MTQYANQIAANSISAANEQVSEVLSQAEAALTSTKYRLQALLIGPQPEPPSGAATVAYHPTISGQSMDIRTLAREVEEMSLSVLDRLGAQV